MPLYPNQISTAKKIIECFQSNINYIMMLAQMQSGKSGTFMLVGAELVRLGLIQCFVVISGNNEKDLKYQLKNPDEFWNVDYGKYLLDNVLENAFEMLDVTNEIRKSFQSYCGSDLDKMDTLPYDTLVIVDESHYGQSKNQRIDKCFKKLGIQPDGSKTTNDFLVMSVSATPFSEITDNYRLKQNKPVFILSPGEGYFGLKEMFDNDCICEYNERQIPILIGELKTSEKNIGLFRLSKKISKELVEEECKRQGVASILYDEHYKENTIEEIMTTEQPLCIILKGRISMGKCLPGKEKIAWGVEEGKGNLDTSLQRLLGRFCGYQRSGSGKHIKIYLHKNTISEIKKSGYVNVLNEKNEQKYGYFGKAMNTRKDNIDHKKQHPTIVEKLSILLHANSWDKDSRDLKALIRDYILSESFERVSKNARKFPEAFQTLKKIIADETNIRLSDLTQSSYIKHKVHLLESNHTDEVLEKTEPGCGFQNLNNNTIRVFHEGVPNKCDTSWTIFVQFRTDAVPPNGSFIYGTAKTNGKEIFCHHNEDGTSVQQNGIMAFSMPKETSTNVEAMNHCLQEAIQLGEQTQNIHSVNKITSVHSSHTGMNGIVINKQVYDALSKHGKIYKSVLHDTQKKIKIKRMNGRKPNNMPEWCYARLVSIEWE